MRLLSALFLLFSISTFAGYEGTLQFDSPIDYKRFFCEKTAVPGDYLVKISKGSKSLKLKFKDIDGKRHNIKIKMPRHSLPEHGGSIRLTPGQTGQNFGLEANLDSRVIRSEERSGRENCTIRVRVRRCYPDEGGRNRCRTSYEDRPGNRYVRYILTTHEKNLFVTLLDDEDQEFGESTSRNVHTSRHTTYEGSCQPRR